MKKLFTLLILAFLFTAGSTYAQVNAYSFAQSSGTYTAISGGTVALSGASDDGTTSALPIGFTFIFNGNNFTQVTAAVNGLMNFGTSVECCGYSYPIEYDADAYPNMVAPMGVDLYQRAAGSISYVTTGSAPNRVFTLQWLHEGLYNSGAADGNFNFQVKLYETTNSIQFVYSFGTAPSTVTSYPQIGIASTSTDYNLRSSTTSWATTVNGTSNAATVPLSSTIVPAAGLTFTWSLPLLANPTNVTATTVSTTGINVGFTPYSGNNVIVVYNLTGTFTTPTGAPPIVGGSLAGGTLLYNGLVSPVHHTGLTPSTTYFYKVFSYDGTNYSNGIQVQATTFCSSASLPYVEGFESITANNTLPNCMAATNLGSWVYTYTNAPGGTYHQDAHGGTKIASFYYSGYGSNHWVWSAAVDLVAGQTYIAGVWYITDGYGGWTNFKMAYGSSQTDAAMTNVIANVSNPTNTTYQQLVGTFTPSVSGTYYLGIGELSTVSPYYLTIDDITLAALTVPTCATSPSPAPGANAIVRAPTLSWNNPGSATSYDLYFGTTTNPPFIMNTANSNYSPGTLNPGQTYYWKVVPRNSLGAATGCTEWTFIGGSLYNYCASAAYYQYDEDIKQVTFAGMINPVPPTPSSFCGTYTNYTNVPPPNIVQGLTYPISVLETEGCSGSGTYAGGVSVSIDWNQNGVWDANETYNIGTYSTGQADNLVNGNITIPTNSVLGYTTMRVIVSEGGYYGPCATYYYGETEDYVVNIVPADKDLSVTQWVSPVRLCSATTAPVTIKYKNLGSATQNSYTLRYSLNGGTTWTSAAVTATINPGQELSYTFVTPGNFATLGEYNCQAQVILPGDLVPTNDLLSGVIVRNYPNIVISPDPLSPYVQNFDGATSYWFPYGNAGWIIGTPAKTFISGAASAPNAAITGLTGNYANNVLGWMESPCFDFSNVLKPMFKADIKFKSQSKQDGTLLAYSTDDLNWYVVGNLFDQTYWYNDTAHAYGNNIPAWTGQSNAAYTSAQRQLTGLQGAPHVKLGMFFASNGSVVDEGFAFDNVNVNENPNLQAVCPNTNIEGTTGDTLRLTIKFGQPPYHVKWTPALGLSCNFSICPGCTDPTTCLRPIATPPVTTTYQYKVWDSKAGKAADTVIGYVTVFVYPLLQVTAQYPSVVCDTAITQIYATTTGGVPPYVFHWDNGASLSSTTIYDPIATPHTTTTYHVTVTDNIGFSAFSSVTITTVASLPVVDIHPNVASVCTGDSVQLTATGGSTYLWSAVPANAYISNIHSPNPWVKPTVNTTYSCIVTSKCGQGQDFVNVSILQRPVVTFTWPAGVDDNWCNNHSKVALSGGLPAGGVYSGPGVSYTGTTAYFDPTVVGAGIYNISYTYYDPNTGCPNYASHNVTVWAMPSVNLTLTQNKFCIDAGPYTLAGGNPVGGTYSGPGVSGGVFTPANAGGPGKKAIIYNYVSAHGCPGQWSDTILVVAKPVVCFGNTPTPCLGLPLPDQCLNGPSISLVSYATPAGGTFSGTGVIGNTFTPSTTGTKILTYNFVDGNGCTNFATTSILVKGLPAVAVANGNSTKNDTICSGGTASHSFLVTGTGTGSLWYTMNGVKQTMALTGLSATPITVTISGTYTTTTNYTIDSVMDANSCKVKNIGLFYSVIVNPNPLDYPVSKNDADGHYCANTGGFFIGLGQGVSGGGSQTDVIYYLYRETFPLGGGPVYTGISFDGALANGSSFWFSTAQTIEGRYTILAKKKLMPTQCSKFMTSPTGQTYYQDIFIDHLSVGINPDFNSICQGGTDQLQAYVVNPQISTGPYTFVWAPAADLNTIGYGKVLAHPTVSKWIYVTAYDPAGCTGIDSIYITVNTPPVVTILTGAPSVTICQNDSVALTTSLVYGSGSGPATYVWAPLGSLNVTNPSAPIAKPNTGTTYYVTVSDNNGCAGYANITVNVTVAPNVAFSGANTTTICQGGSFSLPLLPPITGTGPFNYAWTGPSGYTSTSINPTVTPPATPGTYVYNVVITDHNGCKGSGTYSIVVTGPPSVSLGAQFEICNTTAANIVANVTGGSAPYNFVWNVTPTQVAPPVIPNTYNPSIILQPSVGSAGMPSTIAVTVTDQYGCSASGSVVVISTMYPIAHAGDDQHICQGNSTMLTGSGGGLYQWFIQGNPNPLTPVTNNPNFTVNPSVTTTYELRVTSPCGAAVSYVIVYVYPATAVSITGAPASVCIGSGAVTLTGSPSGSGGVFTGPGIVNNGNGTATFTASNAGAPGVKTITYTYTNQNGCPYSATVNITTYALPVVSLNLPANVCIDAPAFALTGGTPVGGTYSGIGVSGGNFNPASGLGAHVITYTYSNANNCSAFTTATITVNQLPTVFNVGTTGNGHYCANAAPAGVHVTLSGSQLGVTYHLMLNGNTFAGTVATPGTGSAIDFGLQTATGIYTVVAYYDATLCQKTMNGSVTVVIDPLPIVYSVTGGGKFCVGSPGVPVGLANSNLGVTYELYYMGSATGITHAGVNGPFDFPDQINEGSDAYTVVATDNVTGCQQTMSGSASITTVPLPNLYTVFLQGQVPAPPYFNTSISTCTGHTTSPITIRTNASECGVLYELYFNGSPMGTAFQRTCAQGPSLQWKDHSTYMPGDWPAGTYTVMATRTNQPPYACELVMRGVVTIEYYTPLSIGVLQQPQDIHSNGNGNGSFTVGVNGDNPSFQWQVSSDLGATWTNISDGSFTMCGQTVTYSGTTGPTLNISNAPYCMTRYFYHCVITGPCNVSKAAVISNAGILYIEPVVNVTAGNPTTCATTPSGSIVHVPIIFHHADSISAISLTIYFDNTSGFTYAGYQLPVGSPLTPTFLSIFSVNNRIGISYFDVSNAINTNYGDFYLVDLLFNTSGAGGTSHFIHFDVTTQGACELAKRSGDIIETTFTDGVVTVVPMPLITSATQVGVPCAGGDINLSVVTGSYPETLLYSWTGPNGFTSTSATPVIHNASAANIGVYHVVVTGSIHGCVGQADVNVDVHKNPDILAVITPEGNSVCSGSGVEIGVNGTELNVGYQLYLNGIAVPGAYIAGTGGYATFGPQPTAGVYTVFAANQYGCTNWMGNSVTVVINPLPLWFITQTKTRAGLWTSVSHYCEGEAGRPVRLSGSQFGVTYYLYDICCCTGCPVPFGVNPINSLVGTGSALTFGTYPAGNYSVVAISAQGCQNVMVGCVNIIKDPLPVGALISGGSTCYGGCVNLHFQMTVGTAPWSGKLNNGTTSTWITIPTASYDYQVCPTVTTTYTLDSVADANYCHAAGTGSAVVTVYPLPGVTCSSTASQGVCLGGNVTLGVVATGSGPFTYLWTGPNGFTSTDLAPVITGVTAANAGQYTVAVTDIHMCVTNCNTTVVVNTPPVPTATSTPACSGGLLELHASATGSGPFSYMWTGPNGFVSHHADTTAPATTAYAGSYTVVVTDANGCTGTTTTTVDVWALPVVTASSNSPVCSGNTINLLATATGYGTLNYSWTGPAAFTSNIFNPVLTNATLAMAGTYNVSVVDGHQCTGTASTVVVVNGLPDACHLSGGGVYCFGCIPPTINLDCPTQIGVNYLLYRNGVNTGILVAGTGAPISFGPITLPGVYTVTAVNVSNNCPNLVSGSVIIIEQAPPTATIHPDVICYGQTAHMTIDLTGDSWWDVIIFDGTHKDTIHVNSGVNGITSYTYTYVPGSGPHILAPTATTTYTILLVTDKVCYNTGNSATVTVNPLPLQYNITGYGYYCNGIGVLVGLSGSQVGVNYTLYRYAVPVATVAGTGFSITFGPQTDGVYTVVATYPATGCSANMIGQAIILTDPGLTGYNVTGGGAYCAGGPGVNITLSGTQAGKEYKLIKNGVYAGVSISGTGSAIVFTNVTAAGTYTVLAFDPQTTCTRNMNGSVDVSINPLPTACIGGGVTVCYGQSATLEVILTGVAPWTIKINDGYVITTHHVVTSPWDTIVTPPSTRTYTLTYVKDANCENVGCGSAVVVINSPEQFVVTGGGSYCAGGTGVHVSLAGSTVGVNYALYLNAVATGQVMAGTGGTIDFGLQTAPGTYSVIATNPSNGCSRQMSGTVVIVISGPPAIYNVTGGGSCCLGCTHVFVCLDGSQSGIAYELYKDGVATGIIVYGNGSNFCYGYATASGIYTIKGTNLVTGCWSWMNGSATVVIYPIAQAGISLVGNGNICLGDSVQLSVSFSAGTAPFSFGLYNGVSSVDYLNIASSTYTFWVHPGAAGTFNYTLSYVSDAHGCYSTTTTGFAHVVVNQLPGVYLPPFSPVCIDNGLVTLTGGTPSSPGTGSYSGVGVTGTSFDPMAAGPGSHVITYTYSDPLGCTGMAYSIIVVNPLPVVDFSIGDYCVDLQQPVLVSATVNGAPATGGSFTGDGITDNGDGTAWFNPASAGIGSHVIEFSYTDVNGCYGSVSYTSTVYALPTVYFYGFSNPGGVSQYCVSQGPVTLTGVPAGGTFSGPGIVNGNQFDPAVAGVNTGSPYEIWYMYEVSNTFCSNAQMQLVNVYPAPPVCQLTGGGFCCYGCNVTATLICSSVGYSYQLMHDGTLPVGAPQDGTGGPLTWNIGVDGDYTVVASDPASPIGCTATMSGVVHVTLIAPPEAVVSGSTTICGSLCTTVTVNLSGTAPFTIWFTDGVDTVAVSNITSTSWDTLVCPSVTSNYSVVHVWDAYCVNDGTGTATVTVTTAPVVYSMTITNNGIVCSGSTGANVGLDGSEAGQTYELYIDGNPTGVMVPGNNGPISFGNFSIPGTYTAYATACPIQMNGAVFVTVVTAPSVNIFPMISNVCLNAGTFTLMGGTPAGGSYTVDGFTTSDFDPAFYGVGTHTVMYYYTDPNTGCMGSATQDVTVYGLPQVSFNALPSTVCADAAAITMSATPAGGVYTGDGVVGDMFDPSMAGTGSHTITYTYADGNGCSASATWTVMVNAVPSIQMPQFDALCAGGSAYVLPTAFPTGGVYSGVYVSGGVFTPTVAGTFTVTYTVTVGGCTSSATEDITVNNCAVYQIGGQITYDNTSATVMNNVGVQLMQGNTVIASSVTNASGQYTFTGVTPGSYTVRATTNNKPWGGVNSADALLILKHYTHTITLTGLRLVAADVNADNSVNAIDALMVARRFVNQISTFPAGDWAYQVGAATVTNADVTVNFKALCFGDVNGSYTPPYVKVNPTIFINTAGVKQIKSYESFELPVNVNGNIKIGSISLVVNYPENLVDVEGVVINGTTKDVLYTANNGELRISWYSLKEMTLLDKETLLTLKLKSRNISGVADGELAISPVAISELSDINAITLQNVNLTYPKLVVAVSEYSISNYPNPFKSVTEITYNLPEAGKVSLKVFNLLGEQVAVLVNNVDQAANSYKVEFNGSSLAPGVYTYKIEVNGVTKDFIKSSMMVLTK